MSRLRHSAPALLRAFQVSQKQIFLLIEGHNFDGYVYGRIAQHVCANSGIQYQIVSARELPGATGGKRSLLRFFRYLRRFAGLVLSLGSRRRTIVFFLDKDVDDLTQQRASHPHVCYTTKYDLEGHILAAGDLQDAIAVSLSVDPQLVAARLPNVRVWQRELALLWLEWTSICLYVALRKLPAPSYGMTSRVNLPLDTPTARLALEATLRHLEGLTALSHDSFLSDFGSVSRLVRKCFDRQLQDIVFKGKWYFTLMDLNLRNVFAGLPCNFQHLPARLASALLGSIDYAGDWAEVFRDRLTRAVELVS